MTTESFPTKLWLFSDCHSFPKTFAAIFRLVSSRMAPITWLFRFVAIVSARSRLPLSAGSIEEYED